MRHLSSVCALAVGAVLSTTPAWGADAVDVTLNVGHAEPGATVHVTVTPGCDATGVRLALSGRSAADDESGTAEAAVDAQPAAPGSWEGDLVLPGDLAAPQPVDVRAEATCSGATAVGSAPLRVDGFGSQELSLSPTAVPRGGTARYAMTGGRGSCWWGAVTDAAGRTWSLFSFGASRGTRLDATLDPGSDMSSQVYGSFDVPDGMAVGTAVVTVHCSQTVDSSEPLEVLPELVEPTGGSAEPPAPNGGTTSDPPGSGPTGSKVSLGGGLPVVPSPLEQADPRFPLPTLAPPLPSVLAQQAPDVARTAAAVTPAPLRTISVVLLLPLGLLTCWWAVTRRRRADARRQPG